MPEEQESSHSLSIRCPSCRQRFNVDGGLMERMVECGGCDTRFRINDDVIIRSKKFYPGERGGSGLNRFQRVPLSAAAAPEGMQTMRYADFNHPEQLGPASPLRVIAGAAGVVLMLITALLFMFSNDPGEAMSSMAMGNKLIIGGFVSVLGFILLVYANPRARVKAAFVGLLLAAGVISVPLFFEEVEPPRTKGSQPIVARSGTMFPEDEIDPLEVMKSRFGTKPLESERSRLEEKGGSGNAYGVFLTDISQRNKLTVRDYLIRETEAEPSSHPYPRDDGDYLMVLTGVESDLETVASIAAKLGTVEETHPDLGVIVVKVNNAQFVAGSADKLNNEDDPAFYELNMRELSSIDIDRVSRSVGRLAAVEPKIYRTDISRMLVELLTKPGIRFHGDIARALLVWAEDPTAAGQAALEVIRKHSVAGLPIPETVVDLVVKGKPEGAATEIHTLWLGNPNLWQSSYIKLGQPIEQDVARELDTESQPLQRSALTILGRVGSERSLPAIRKLQQNSDPGIRILADRAVEEISER